DDFIRGHGLTKGAMHLIDEARARELYDAMGPGIEMSGGSAANTIVGVASFGGAAQYVGKVRDDQLGDVFRHDLRATGVTYDVPAATGGPPTGRCLILVTPDAQRTLNTFLGVSVRLGPEDIDPAVIARGRILYLEGYLFDPPRAQEAFRTAARHAHAAGRYVALTLSDPFCVDRHRAAFLYLVEHHVDILLANEAEICSLYQTKDFDAALQAARVRRRRWRSSPPHCCHDARARRRGEVRAARRAAPRDGARRGRVLGRRGLDVPRARGARRGGRGGAARDRRLRDVSGA